MGLEGVELVLAMEEAFEITITDEEAKHISTPKAAIELIASKLEMGGDDTCLNQVAFYKFRKLLVDEFGVRKNDVTVETNLRELIEPYRYPEFWKKVGNLAMLRKLPDMSRPSWIVYCSWFAFLVATLYWGVRDGFLIGFVAGLVVFFTIMYATKSQKKLIPASYAKVGGLIRFIVCSNPSAFKKNHKWSYSQVRQEVKNIVIEQLGVERYEEHWEFVKDYGIDR